MAKKKVKDPDPTVEGEAGEEFEETEDVGAGPDAGFSPKADRSSVPAGEEGSEDEPPEPTEAELQVQAAKEELDQAQTKLAEAQAKVDEAKAKHEDAVKVATEDADPEKHIYLQGPGGSLERVEFKPEAGVSMPLRERRILFRGMNFEHVSEGPNGVWVYRQMP